MTDPVSGPVVITGANGFVGSRVCGAVVERGATVRAVVRRAGTAPDLPGVEEHVGDFGDAHFAASVLDGAGAAVTTVHPMGSDHATQERVGVEATAAFARAAARRASTGSCTCRPPPSMTAHRLPATSTSRPRWWATTTTTTR